MTRTHTKNTQEKDVGYIIIIFVGNGYSSDGSLLQMECRKSFGRSLKFSFQ